jgi:hypothetical protein
MEELEVNMKDNNDHLHIINVGMDINLKNSIPAEGKKRKF